jgi:hypothetical protein
MRLSVDPSGEIDELVEQLESARSPWQKVKVLAKAWRTVRKLQPDERFLVAKNLGLEGAEVFLDKLGDPYIGVPTDDLLDIVRAADAQDFSRWKEVIGRLRRPEERKEILRKGLEEAREALLQEQQEVESAENEPEHLEVAPGPPPLTLVVEAPESAEEASEEPDASLAEIVETWEEPVAKTAAEIDIEEEDEGEAAEIIPVVEQAVGEELEVPAPDADEAAITIPETPVLQKGRIEEVVDKLSTSSSLVARLRRAREVTAEMRDLGVGNLERLLECFPEGWARRRALAQMLRAGIPGDFHDAMTLVSTESSASARLWCLTALIDGRDLEEDEKEFLLSSNEAPLVKRRLESRLRESS